MTKKVLFIGKKSDSASTKACDFLKLFFDVVSYFGDWGEVIPSAMLNWQGDYIISFLSRWIIPEALLSKAEYAAINFHPGSVDFPGIGGYNFALYEGVKEYGVTCHHMTKQVDTGNIIKTIKFPVFENDNVSSLIQRTHDYLLFLFYEVINEVITTKRLPRENIHWSRKPYTRTELNKLDKITPSMNRDEINRRIKATVFGQFKPKVEIEGYLFELVC